MSSPIIIPDDSFQPVHSRRKTRRATAKIQANTESFATRVEKMEREIRDIEWMKGCQKQVEASFQTLQWNMHEVLVLCLGLGSPLASKNATAQLVFITSICHSLNISPGKVEFFDPHFSQDDVQGLLAMGFKVLTENKHGKHAVNSNTLLFMPHCGVELYENILRENWAVDDLQRLLLVGNVLQEYETVTPLLKFERLTPCVSRICKCLICDMIPPLDVFPLAFNNMAVQYINPSSVPSRADAMWNLPRETAEEKLSVEIT